MARRHVGRVVGRSARRESVWLSAGFATQVVSSSNTLLASLNAAALALRPFTIVRTRLTVVFESDQTGADEKAQAVLTFQVVKETASAAGIGSLPGGIDEADGEFFVYRPLMQNFGFISGTGAQQIMGQGNYWDVDSKAMRKVGIDEDIVVVLDIRTLVGCAIGVEGRQLIKLH